MNAFEDLARLLDDRIGMTIDPRRRTSIEARLAGVMADCGFSDPQEFVRRLRSGLDPALLNRTVDAMVTCETLFFRDRAPFEAMRGIVLPKLREARRDFRNLRIWSAACATGQEPYSIAMIVDDMTREFAGWRVDIIASDVSQTALAAARKGLFSQFEVQRGLPTPMLLRYFRKEAAGWRVSEHLQAAIDFRQINLVSDFGALGHFDVVLCRNVLMYMDVERRRDILRRLSAQLAPDGYLLLGATETIVGLTDDFVATPGFAGLFTHRPQKRANVRLVVNS
ncbi:MAG: protein-glutamate O-methyltransferase CheR [Methylobacteriaceae bacterium]|nr:protein-glutamate O-methyltransferase CheR [Methylobacteriaceae bacterium]